MPGYLEARDPATGELSWRWYATPQKAATRAGDVAELDMAKHGGGMTWQPLTYDPELNLIYLTTGNPQPVVAYANRQGANLYTGVASSRSIADTGKMKWYFQASPHDTHDWDATQMPVLIDAEIHGQPRKLLAQATRNGTFLPSRPPTGKTLVSSRVSSRPTGRSASTRRASRSRTRPKTRRSPARS